MKQLEYSFILSLKSTSFLLLVAEQTNNHPSLARYLGLTNPEILRKLEHSVLHAKRINQRTHLKATRE